jgi:hydrophobic/amphiphilic exporter-1 (mainly G- bacteria), HAE1 family
MKRALAWAAEHPVFANLLMIFLLVAGGLSAINIRREMFPQFDFDAVTVTVVYPGAAPAEIERSVSIKIEEAVRGLDGVRRVESTSSEGRATVKIEVDSTERDPRDVLVDVRNEVSRIDTFPEDINEPQIQLVLNRSEVMTLVLAGPEGVDEETLARVSQELEEDLLLLAEVSEVSVAGVRPYAISVFVREADLQRYGLTFDQVSTAIRGASLDLPLGTMRSDTEERLLRVQRQRYTGRELASVPVLSQADGTRVTLGDVARIEDGFDTDDSRAVRLDGRPAVTLTVRRAESDDVISVARATEAFVAEREGTLPAGLTLAVWKDDSTAVVERLSLLSTNGLQGLALVFAVLLFFLGARLSFWVAFGLPVAFVTALVLLQTFGGSLNMISSFALIMILGILVDDSIVVAENVARHMAQKGYTVQAAVDGLLEVTWPVIASVTTTAVAFLPLFFLPGIMGKFIRIMPVAVVACLIASLVECLLILPAHLAHGKAPRLATSRGLLAGLARIRARIDGATDRFVVQRYGPSVDWALRQRYVVAALAAGFMIVIAGAVASGRPRFTFFPRLDAEYLTATVVMPQGTSAEQTLEVVSKLEEAAGALGDQLAAGDDGSPIARRVLTSVGEGGVHKAKVTLELSPSGERQTRSLEVQKAWTELAGDLPQARQITFGGGGHGPGGRPIEIRVLSRTGEDANGEAVSDGLREALDTYPGVFNVEDNLQPGKQELRFDVRPQADALGVSLRDLARQLNSGFTGQEVHKLQRGQDEVEVRVRYDAATRRDTSRLADMRLRTGDQSLVPLEWAAEVERGRSLSQIERRDGRRVVKVMGDVDTAVTNANEVVRSLRADVVPDLEARYPGVTIDFGGQQEEQTETMVGLLVGFVLAMCGIYAILALLFRSYLQPLVVMTVIPMGFGGAVLGHIVLGWPIMIFSIFGMVGLTGIVVNDALVLIDFINRHRAQGHTALEAAAQAGRVRFRAVFLTTVTTVAGLLPILLMRSLTAQFIIPMALSISAGVMTATILTLYVVPAAYLIIEDLKGLFVVPTPPVNTSTQVEPAATGA